MPAHVINNRYIATTAAGAVDHFTKIAENDMAIIAIKIRMGIGTAGLFVEFKMLALLGIVNAEKSISQNNDLANLFELLSQKQCFFEVLSLIMRIYDKPSIPRRFLCCRLIKVLTHYRIWMMSFISTGK
jgi:hypothetical protein